ncbi:MAG: chemotaxis protein CheW [Chitinivibrionales bacterium]
MAHSKGSQRYDALREKIKQARKSIHAAWEPSKEESRQLLRERARALAARPPEKPADDKIMELLVFELSGEHYGLETSYIAEVFFLDEYTPLPFTPAWLVGICSLRGRFVSITDIRGILGMPIKGIGEFNKVILLQSQTMEFGILADAVVGIQNLPQRDLQKEFHLPGEHAENYIAGVTPSRLIVLDSKKLLSDEKMIAGTE